MPNTMDADASGVVISLASGEYLGDVTRREVVGGIVLAETRYAADARLAPHRHEAASLFLVVRDRLTVRSAAGTHVFAAGAVTFDPEDHVHGGWLHGRAPQGFSIELPPAWAARYDAAAALRRPAAAFSGRASRVPQIMARLRYELRARDAARGLAVQGLALDLAAALAREPAVPQRGRHSLRAEVRRAAALLRDAGPGGTGPVPTWAAIAAAVGAPAAPLGRAFRAHVRCTPAAYVRRARLDAAAGALAATPHPIGRIALDAGYYDQAHFTRAFRAAFGVPPSAYRRALLMGGDSPPSDVASRRLEGRQPPADR